MKQLLILLTVLFSIQLNSQIRYFTKTGNVEFEASVPSFEEVAAKNNSVTAILNTDSGEFAALAFVKAFRFKNALMEEHFNENYAESDQYPKITFKGEIEKIDVKKLDENKQESFVSGMLTFHGVTKKISDIPINIKRVDETVMMSGNFSVLASDFDIKIPKIVQNKLSNEVIVSFSFELIKK